MKRELLFVMLLVTLSVVGMEIKDALAEAPAVQTQQVGPLKIGFINIQRAISESEKGKAVIGKLDDEISQAKAKLDAQKKEIDRLNDDYKANKDKWDIATRQAKMDELEAKAKKINRDAEDYDAYYRKRRDELLKPIVSGLNQVIIDLGKKENYSVIFEIGGGILYINPNLELTNKVISNYNLQK